MSRGIDASLHHVLNCNRFNKLRDFPHNMVRDSLWNMSVSNGFSSETEVPLKDICPSIRTLERMDVSSTFAESYDVLLDVKTVDLQNNSNCGFQSISSSRNSREQLKH
ncbi:hypothetical protein RCL1_007089 [Eukaryota sp. TZLM3-RCL]